MIERQRQRDRTAERMPDDERPIQVERGDEVVIIIKTRATLAEPVRLAVKEMHSYTTPAVLVIPVESVDPDYQAWIMRETASES